MAEDKEDGKWTFDMHQHALVIAFPYGDIEGVGSVVIPPTFVTNMPTCDHHDATEMIEAALLFALDVVRNGQYREVDAEAPTDLSSMKEQPHD
jgi:hypothetical protein